MAIKGISTRGLALTLSLGALGTGLIGCAGKESHAQATDQQAQAMKGDSKSCGQNSCSGDKDASAKPEAAPTAEKGQDKSCGQGSCS